MTETRVVTIVRPDNMVIIDGKAHEVDLSSIQEFISAVQWDGPTQTGEIEFVQAANTPHRLNIPIISIDGWAPAIEAWEVAEKEEQIALTKAISEQERETKRLEAETASAASLIEELE